MSLRVGAAVEMNEDALANYGEKYRDQVFYVTHVATKYMAASEFFAKGKPQGYHPGFDSASGGALYDLADESGKDLPMSLYGWELKLSERARRRRR